MKNLRVTLLFSAIFLVALIFGAKTHATTNNWLSSATPEFKQKEASLTDSELPTTTNGSGNITCSILSFKKRDGGFTASLNGIYKESVANGCYNQTSVGLWDNNGYYNVSGTELVAETKNTSNVATGYMTFPNSDVFVSNVSSAPVGLYVWLDHLRTSVKTTSSLDGKITATVKPQAQQAVADKNGNKLALKSNNFAVSEDGTWLIADSPGKAIVRINTVTMEVLPFAPSFEFGNGIGAALKTAISGDGRYVFLYSKYYSFFKVFDLNTCGAIPDTITQPVSCASKDMLSFVKSKIKDLSSILQIRFVTNDSINLYAAYDAIASPKTGLFALASPGNSLNATDYLALGDSFSSGEGAHQYELGTDHDNNKCHLSRVSYPYLIAKQLNFSSFHSVACSGAQRYKITEGKTVSRNSPPKPTHINQYWKDVPETTLGEWLPGYSKQIEMVKKADPNVITLTLGGNDINFSDKIINCIKPGTCYESYEDKKEVFNEIEALHPKLTKVYKKLKAESRKATRIYVVGYPSIAFAEGNCALNVRMNHDELVFAQTVVDQLNATIKSASETTGVFYVDVSDALIGNRLCETNSNNIAMNGITAGNDIFSVIGNESYHPNQFGHELLTIKILEKTNNFTLGVAPPTNTTVPKISETAPTLANSQKTNRPLKKTSSDEIASPKKAKRSSKIKVKATNLDNGIAPNTNYTVSVGSNTTTTTSDADGNIDVDVDINPNDPAGPTNVNVSGNDVTGSPISINDGIFIDGPDGDLDQDGVIDEKDSCLGVTNSGTDYDQDGIDDVCDTIVGPAPTTPTNITPPNSGNTTNTNTPEPSSNDPSSTSPETTSASTADLTIIKTETISQNPLLSVTQTPVSGEVSVANSISTSSKPLQTLTPNKIDIVIPAPNPNAEEAMAKDFAPTTQVPSFWQKLLEIASKIKPESTTQNSLWVLAMILILFRQMYKWQREA